MLIAAFTMGLLGSLHCVGMCGPIALALPLSTQQRLRLVGQLLIFNSGRILTYLLLGLVVGLLGSGFRLAGAQSSLSIGIGILILIIALGVFNVEHQMLRLPIFQRWTTWVRQRFNAYLREANNKRYFQLGLLNGLLPCGLVYLAIVGAATTGSVFTGGMYMLLFGLGTLPLLLLSTFAGVRLGGQWRQYLYRFYPYMLAALGVWLVYRGIQFHLPNNFNVWSSMQDIIMCH